MSVNAVIFVIIAVFVVIAAFDKAFGNHLKLGSELEKGLDSFGPLALSMVGMISLAPLLAKILSPVVVPAFAVLGADPAMFAGTLLANDMGGYPLAIEMAESEDAGLLAGTVVAALLGDTIVFTVPVGLGIIAEKNREAFARGILVGVTVTPVGVITGGLAAGFDPRMIFSNLLPVIIVALAIALGLILAPKGLTKGFLLFGKGLVSVITITLGIGAFEYLTGYQIMPIGWELVPITEGLEIVATICVFLMGAFPFMYFLTKVGKKPLGTIGRALGIGETSASGFLITLANPIPTFQMMEDMNSRGVFLNTAWAVSSLAAFGDHLGFTAGVAPQMIFPMIVGKMSAAVTALIAAVIVARKMYPSQKEAS